MGKPQHDVFAGMEHATSIHWEQLSHRELTTFDARKLADILRHNPHVEALHISTPITEDGALALAEAIKGHPRLQDLHFKAPHLAQHALEALATASLSLPQLHTFQMKEAGIEAPLMRHICELAGSHPTLHSLCLSKNAIAPEQLADVSTLFRNHHWQRIRLMDCGLDESGLTTLARNLGEQPLLCRFHLQGNVADRGQYPAFSDAVIASGSKNLLSTFPATDRLKACSAAIEAECDAVVGKLRGVPLNEQGASVVTNAQAIARLPAIGQMMRSTRFEEYFKVYMRELPPLPATLSTAALLRPANRLKQCPAENPANWREPEALLRRLEEAGETIDAAWLDRHTRQGESLLSCGLAGGGAKFVQALNSRGIQLRGDYLLDEQQKPKEALRTLIALDNCPALFGLENWQGATSSELQQTLKAIPPEQRSHIGNRHLLAQQLRQQQQETQLGR
jgi:hypothetical protein